MEEHEIPDGWREVDGPEGVRVFRRTEDRVPTPVYILGEATRRPITLDEYEVVRSALRATEQPAPPLDRITRLRGTLALIADGRAPAQEMAAEALRRDGDD